tara:strand:- start:7 stop:195 length:189 start_codon:yes stop_codon:yes gene_type:complete
MHLDIDNEEVELIEIDVVARKFYLYGSDGSEIVIPCDMDQFMNMLVMTRDWTDQADVKVEYI